MHAAGGLVMQVVSGVVIAVAMTVLGLREGWDEFWRGVLAGNEPLGFVLAVAGVVMLVVADGVHLRNDVSRTMRVAGALLGLSIAAVLSFAFVELDRPALAFGTMVPLLVAGGIGLVAALALAVVSSRGPAIEER
ncbi:MAG: hypothetical protein M3Y87_01490 [Myxococcota bacterium]|nr:hypothetical protein [Myxococcota bacterium]